MASIRLELDHPWTRVNSDGPHRKYVRGPVTVLLESPTEIPHMDYHVSISLYLEKPGDALCLAVFRDLGLPPDVYEVPSVVNPYVRHFTGRADA